MDGLYNPLADQPRGMDRGSTEWIHAWIQWSGLQPCTSVIPADGSPGMTGLQFYLPGEAVQTGWI